jgi:Flp pilus assembly protein TadG
MHPGHNRVGVNVTHMQHRIGLARNDDGAAMVEMAIILPLLVLLLMGIVEFGRAYNTKITLTHATREAVRVYSISGDTGDAADAVVAASHPLNPALLSVSTTACEEGEPTSVTATYPFSYDIPLFGSATISMSSTAVMRCGG